MQLVLRAKEMMEYLPVYWHENEEMKRIFHAESVEIDGLHENALVILNDAFLATMGENRILEWEKWLKLPHGGTIEERRTRILQYFGVLVKLNEQSIKTIVARLHNNARAFTRIVNSHIHVMVLPLPENSMDELDFTRLNQELSIKKPCHLGLIIERAYSNWNDIKTSFDSWADVRKLNNWEEVVMFIPE